MLWRRTTAILAALAATGCATACDSGESSSRSTTTIVIETTDPSHDKVDLQAPRTVAAGPVEIELRNRGDTPHDAQLFRVDGRHATSEVAAFLEDFDGTARPRWLHAAGGVAPVAPGGSATVRQVLEPGTYIVADTQERARSWTTGAAKGGTAKIEVTGEGSGDLPATPARITAREHGFDVAGIRPGRNRVSFRNAGQEPHQVVVLRLADGKPIALARRIAVERIGDMTWVPVDVPGNRATTVLDPGDEQITTLDFEPGRYVLLCLVPPRSGGQAQWMTGTATNLSVGSGADASSTAAAAATRVVIETTDPSPHRVSLRAPASVPAGLVEIELRNRGDTLHDAQLLRAEGDHSADDVVAALENGDAQPWPGWLHAAGGVAPVRPSGSATVTQVLSPGAYYVADTQERPDPSGGRVTNAVKDGIARIEVTGGDDAGDRSLPAVPATITAKEYGFRTSGIVPGRNRVTFRNTGSEFHQVVAFPIPRGTSFATGRRAILDARAETAWVPVDVPHERATTAIEGGGELIAELTFRRGRHLLLCFVSDRAGGGAQWTLGMSAQLKVGAP